MFKAYEYFEHLGKKHRIYTMGPQDKSHFTWRKKFTQPTENFDAFGNNKKREMEKHN